MPPIGPVTPGVAVIVTPDANPTPYLSMTASTATMPVASTADVQTITLELLNAVNASVANEGALPAQGTDGMWVRTRNYGTFRLSHAGSGFAADNKWVVDATVAGHPSAQWIRSDLKAANDATIAAMGTVPGTILTAANNTIPYPSASITRSNHKIEVGDAARWERFTSGVYVQFDVGGPGFLVVDLNVPHNSILTSLVVTLKGAGAHAALPATKPQMYLNEIDLGAGTSTQISNIVTDPSGSTGAYQTLHTMTINKRTDGVTALAWPVDSANKHLALYFTGEAGANSVILLQVFGVQTVCTVTEQDKG